MKTATIRVNHIFGTKNEYCADIFYRGKLIKSFDSSKFSGFGSKPNSLAAVAQQWAHANTFSHCRVNFG